MNPYELELYARARQAEMLARSEARRQAEQVRRAARLSRMGSAGGTRGEPNGSARPATRRQSRRRQPILARVAQAAIRLLSPANLPSREAVARRSRPA